MGEKTLDQLKQEIAVAATTGDDANFNALIKEYNSRKADIAKALQEQARKEAEALAGAREKLAKAIHKAVIKIPELAGLPNVKATGFTFKLDAEGVTYKSVALAVPAVKARSGGGGGNHITSKAEYGMTLDEIFNKFGTDEDKVKLEAAESNSGKWQVKNAVKKEALKAGLLQPAK